MKISPLLLYSTQGSLLSLKDRFENLKLCGFLRGESGSIHDRIRLGARESCLYRVKPDSGEAGNHYVHLNQRRQVPCSKAEMYIIQNGKIEGPFCKNANEAQRVRRSAVETWAEPMEEKPVENVYSPATASYTPPADPMKYEYKGTDLMSDQPFDVVYTHGGNGMKFSFNFWFEFELMPGMPMGQAQDGFYDEMGKYAAVAKPDGAGYGMNSGYASGPSDSPDPYGTDAPVETTVPIETTVPVETTVKTTTPECPGPAWCDEQCPGKPWCATTTEPTTEAPTTEAPTTEAPTTEARSTEPPTTEAPTTEAPTTKAPTTIKPTTEAPTTVKPTTEAPTTVKPTTEAPTTVKPTTEAPTTVKPTTEAPTTVKPTTEAPTTQGGCDSDHQCSAGECKMGVCVTTTEAPTTEAPTTEAPTTAGPTTPEPTTGKPTTEAPTTSGGCDSDHQCSAGECKMGVCVTTTEAPTTEAPTTEAKTTKAPTTVVETTVVVTTVVATTVFTSLDTTVETTEYYTTEATTPLQTTEPTTPPVTYGTDDPYTTEDPYTTGYPTYYPPTTGSPTGPPTPHCKGIPPPNKQCPWKSSHALENGDCPNRKGKCNLKYFKVCGGHWFTQIYCNVCQWKESLQLVPMMTAKLVPLGINYEKQNGQCNGFGQRSLDDLLVSMRDITSLRDVPQCAPSAGVVPCHLLDFRKVMTAAAFYHKMENLFENHLKGHCNNEWNVHFKALLQRLKGSLTCAGGLKPDHPMPNGFLPQPVQPGIQGGHQGGQGNQGHHQGQQQQGQQGDQPSHNQGGQIPNPYPNNDKPGFYTPPKFYTPHAFTDDHNNNLYNAVEGPVDNSGFCPYSYDSTWNKGEGHFSTCSNGMCNLKFVGKCHNNLFNKVYTDVCKWQESLQLLPMINNEIVAVGLNYERHRGKCNNNIPAKYQDIYGNKEVARNRRSPVDIRDVAKCHPDAGIIPCNFIQYHTVNHERHMYWKVFKLVTHIGKKCNDEWVNKMNALLLRFKNSITCPGGMPDHNPDLLLKSESLERAVLPDWYPENEDYMY